MESCQLAEQIFTNLPNGILPTCRFYAGEKLISEGAANLLALSGKIDAAKMKRPSFQMVLTGIGDYVYRRNDGGARDRRYEEWEVRVQGGD